MTIHEPGCECPAYACELRRKGIQISPRATPSRYKLGRVKPPEAPSWEKGIVGETNRDGTVMPYLNAEGNPIRVKEWSENRHDYEAIRRRQLADNPSTNEE